MKITRYEKQSSDLQSAYFDIQIYIWYVRTAKEQKMEILKRKN